MVLRRPPAAVWPLGVFAAWLVAHEVQVIVAPHASVGPARVIHIAGLVVAAVACAIGGWREPGERAAWACIAAAIGSWTLGEIYFATVLWDAKDVPVPSWADAGYLGTYPLLFAGLILLARRRVRSSTVTLWIDGLTAALSLAALSAAVVLQAVLGSIGGRRLAVATNLAYPLGDLVLLGLLVALVAINGWRIERRTAVLAAGVLSFWAADSIFLVQQVQGTYVAGGWLDIGWWGGLLLLAIAAWMRPAAPAPAGAAQRTSAIVVPAAFATAGIGLLIYAGFEDVTPVSIVLAGAAMLAVVGRLVVTFRQNVAVMRASRREALTDALTGLGNRRQLTLDLEVELGRATVAEPVCLVLFDLDGFKHYNDTFGHPAGDALLVRLAAALRDTLADRATAYRMGGDEFCALVRVEAAAVGDLVASAARALSDHGDGFAISASFGSVLLPAEAGTASEALRIADTRMYSHKRSGRIAIERQTHDLLLTVLAEISPKVEHVGDVADLAVAVARQLGMPADAVARVGDAARLHDIGKLGIPDAILSKPGPLDDAEWEFMRRHTLIGERIIGAAPMLRPVARLVRSTHERYDGGGYPDGLAGEDIPLGARIIAVCDAFHAMTAERSYREARSADEAVAELERCAGGQFDPAVVRACALTLEMRARRLAA
ncbi:MAG TPA: diguanylate cyclase [Solirubrobacteraceae bacterium]